MLRLLVTDPFHPVVTSTIRRLRDGHEDSLVVGVDQDAGRYPSPPGIDRVVRCPCPEDPGFCEAIGAIAERHGMRAVLPWTDRDALACARGIERLAEHGVAVLCPRAELVELACDKWVTAERLGELGVPVPRTCVAGSAEELRVVAAGLGYPEQPLIVKPRASSGGRGVWRLRARVDPLSTSPCPQVPIEAMAAILAGSPRGTEVVVQEELSGIDTSIDVLCHDGHVETAVARTRETTVGGLCVTGTVGPLDRALADVIERLVHGLCWSSIANVQVVRTDAGPVVYEINPRAAGSIGVCAYTGVDLLRQVVDGEPVAGSAGRAPTPVSFRRHWLDQWWPI